MIRVAVVGCARPKLTQAVGIASNAALPLHPNLFTMSFLRLSCAPIVGALLTLATSAYAQGSAWQPFVSVTPVYQGYSDVDDGGRFKVSSAIVRGGAFYALGAGSRIGVTLNYDQYDYSFDNASAFGPQAPWGTVRRYGVSVPLSWGVSDGWSLSVSPSVDWFGEKGASSSDSRVWGAMFSGVKQFEGGNRLGVGVGVYEQIEKTSAFPFVVVDWRLNERWRLVNPLPSGPTGPAGLELDYRFDGGWTAGVGAAYRSVRFRLADRPLARGGVGEETGVPLFLRVTRQFGPQMALHLYGGAVVGGKLRVEDASGELVEKQNFKAAPLLGLSLVGRF